MASSGCTTLQLFIAAAGRVAGEYGCDVEARLLTVLARNNPDLAKSADEAFKVWPSKENREAFVDVMAKEGLHEDESNRIHEAYDFFLDVLRMWAKSNRTFDSPSRA